MKCELHIALAAVFAVLIAPLCSATAAATAPTHEPTPRAANASLLNLDLAVDSSRIVARTSERFVSFNLDFHLCAVEQPDRPGVACNWHNASVLLADLPRLLPLASALSPYGTALLRIGGGPADNIVYDVGAVPRPRLQRTAGRPAPVLCWPRRA